MDEIRWSIPTPSFPEIEWDRESIPGTPQSEQIPQEILVPESPPQNSPTLPATIEPSVNGDLHYPALQLSKSAEIYTGQRKSHNTTRASKSAMKLFAEFVLALINTSSEKQYEFLSIQSTNKNLPTISEATYAEQSIMRVLLNGRTPTQGLDKNGLERLRHFLIEFSVSYVSRKTNKPVGPSTMLGYIRSIQRRLHEFGIQLNLFEEPIFNHPVTPQNYLFFL